MSLDRFNEIWLIDFEFRQPDGERPDPICMVALELYSGVTLRFGPSELCGLTAAPFGNSTDVLVVAYYAVAEMNCYLALGWSLPLNLIDLYAEFSNATNGTQRANGRSLLGALVHYGLTGINFAEKESMRSLAMRGGPFSSDEMRELLEYCESDVRALAALLPRMEPLELDYALLRGRYVRALARVEATGVPIDSETLARLRDNWELIKLKLIEEVGRDFIVRTPQGEVKYPIYDGSTFKADRFTEFLEQLHLPWPRLASGPLDLSDDAFRQMARLHPQIAELRELRHALSQLRLNELTVGRDGRNRCMLSPFASRTSRNQPSTSKFIFGASVWLRGLIQPEPGMGLAYIDWSGQEYGIAAALSGDERMMADYQSGDPYLAFAKHVGLVPPTATKKSHPTERETFKVALGLGAMYGAGPPTVATMIGKPPAFAAFLLQRHRETYRRFWAWSDAAVSHAMLHNKLWTVFGWRIVVAGGVNPRSLSNFPVQANGAEMMRLACIFVTEVGIRLCCPVHDALLVEAPADQLEGVVADTRRMMARASRTVLDGFELRTGVESVVYPARYRDEKRGGAMWDRVMRLLPSV